MANVSSTRQDQLSGLRAAAITAAPAMFAALDAMSPSWGRVSGERLECAAQYTALDEGSLADPRIWHSRFEPVRIVTEIGGGQ